MTESKERELLRNWLELADQFLQVLPGKQISGGLIGRTRALLAQPQQPEVPEGWKPTIAELEWVLAAPDGIFETDIKPNGEISAKLTARGLAMLAAAPIAGPSPSSEAALLGAAVMLMLQSGDADCMEFAQRIPVEFKSLDGAPCAMTSPSPVEQAPAPDGMVWDTRGEVPILRDAQQPAVPEGYRLVRADVLAWLHGEAPHPESGDWFERPSGEGAYWWRSRLRKAMLAAAPSTSPHSEGGGT